MEQAVSLICDWAKKHGPKGMKLEVVRLPGKTPLIFIEIDGEIDDTVLLYGHLDKQPEMEGWNADLGPWKPVIKDGKLYGRGGADDGYAAFASLCAIKSLQEQGLAHARCVVMIEACEESGSYDLPFYVDHLAKRIRKPSLVVCLDSGCGNYDQMWVTTSLRGNVVFDLNVEILKEGVHSGMASGIVPSSFRILRKLISRIENEDTGEILIKDFYVDAPQSRIEQAEKAAKVLGDKIYTDFPFVKNAAPEEKDLSELLLNQTWRPFLAATGIGNMPAMADAGNVLRPKTKVKLSLRVPPGCMLEKACAQLKETLEKDPPYGAKVECTVGSPAAGWHAPEEEKWLGDAIENASMRFFGKSAMYMGEGGTIPFMGMLGEKFPKAQFIITGVLGPASNAHGPNEFLHIDMGKKLTACMASIINAHAIR